MQLVAVKAREQQEVVGCCWQINDSQNTMGGRSKEGSQRAVASQRPAATQKRASTGASKSIVNTHPSRAGPRALWLVACVACHPFILKEASMLKIRTPGAREASFSSSKQQQQQTRSPPARMEPE